MRVAFHHIAYQPLAICNALSMERLEATAARAGLHPDATVMDIGCAYGGSPCAWPASSTPG